MISKETMTVEQAETLLRQCAAEIVARHKDTLRNKRQSEKLVAMLWLGLPARMQVALEVLGVPIEFHSNKPGWAASTQTFPPRKKRAKGVPQ